MTTENKGLIDAWRDPSIRWRIKLFLYWALFLVSVGVLDGFMTGWQ